MVLVHRCTSGILYVFYYFKMPHHSRCMMFNNMAMIHPGAGAVIGYPGDFNTGAWFDVVSVFPGFVFGCFSVFFNNLEEKTVQVKRMVHQAGIVNFPDLQFPYLDGLVMNMRIV